MFTPDGRLLQLEYARLASDHSTPIFVLPLSEKDSTNSKNIDDHSQPQLLAVVTYRPTFRLQERLLVYSLGKGGLGLGGKFVLIGMAGVVADCNALGRKMQEESINHQRMFGTPFTTARQWAMAASSHCQRHALGGGIRPYGASFMVVESHGGNSKKNMERRRNALNRVDNNDDDGSYCYSPVQSSYPDIYITDTSGAIQTLSTFDIDRPRVLVGGGFLRETKLKRKLETDWPEILNRCNMPADQLAHAFRIIADAIRDEDNGQDHRHGPRRQQQQDWSADDASSSIPVGGDLVFEVVLISEERGMVKLTPSQIKRIRLRTAT